MSVILYMYMPGWSIPADWAHLYLGQYGATRRDCHGRNSTPRWHLMTSTSPGSHVTASTSGRLLRRAGESSSRARWAWAGAWASARPALPGAGATPLDSLMERCRSNCPRLIFCNRKQFRSATCVSICGLTHSGRGRRRPFPRIFLFSETRGLCYLQVFVTDAHAFCDRSWTKRSAYTFYTAAAIRRAVLFDNMWR